MDTLKFEYFFHVAGAFDLPNDEFVVRISHPGIRSVAEAFIANLTRVAEASRTPVWVGYLARAKQRAIDEAYLEVMGDLRVRTLNESQNAAFRETMLRLRRAFDDKNRDDPDECGERILVAAMELEQLRSNDVGVRAGLDAILGGMVTSMWTGVEVLASDLWEVAINVHPSGLAELRGKPPPSMPTPKKTFTALVSPDGDKRQTPKNLRLDYLQAHGYNLSHLMGTVLRERFNLQTLDGIREAYIQAFDESCSTVREAILEPALTVLATVRNVLVHRAGIVDQAFLNDCDRCAELKAAFPHAELGRSLPLHGTTVHGLIQPVATLSVKLIEAVNSIVGGETRISSADDTACVLTET